MKQKNQLSNNKTRSSFIQVVFLCLITFIIQIKSLKLPKMVNGKLQTQYIKSTYENSIDNLNKFLKSGIKQVNNFKITIFNLL